MGRIFVSAGYSGIRERRENASLGVDRLTEAQELIRLRDGICQILRSQNYSVLTVPEDLSLTQTIDWINNRAQWGDVALEIQLGTAVAAMVRGAMVFYIANNEERKAHAEQLLQAYLRRVPQLSSRGAKPDTQTLLGQVDFCRQVVIPALVMEVGCLTHSEDRQILQNQRQDIALGIAEGLSTWSRMVTAEASSTAPGIPVYPAIDIVVNGANYDDSGIVVEGNAYIPVDLIDQLGVSLPLDAPGRRINYRNVVFVRAIDLRDLHLAISYSGQQTVIIRSNTPISSTQMERLMGRGNVSEVQMMMFLKSYHPDGLARFPELPKLYREEASLEGINYDIAFAQMCAETHFLRFGAEVKPEQNNFAGLGAIGGGTEGAIFTDPRIGVRAHIQHLKAYASTEPVVQAIVDPRFNYIRRGIAPSISQLSGRWNADPNYHRKILSILKRLYESAGFL